MTFDAAKQPARRRGPAKTVTRQEAEMALSRLRIAAEAGDPLANWALVTLSMKVAANA
jgi:hypothetical protein